jgi:phosphatidylglycerol lysyltransferase
MKIQNITSRISPKVILQIAVALIPIVFCIYFIRHEKLELQHSLSLIQQVNPWLLLVALFICFIYLIVHGMMYLESFRTLNARVSFKSMLLLSLKRGFISVFLPAGGISSYAFFTGAIQEQGVSKTKIHLSSALYGIAGFTSLILVAIPAILLLTFSHNLNNTVLLSFSVILIASVVLMLAIRSFLKKTFVFKLLTQFFPGVMVIINDLKDEKYSAVHFIQAILYSLVIELCGVAHLYIVLYALGVPVNLSMALTGYVVATLMYALSPFMRGLGAVELTLTLTLVQFGVPHIEAISASLLYRFFEFWIPLGVGALSFFYRRDNLLLRIFPAFLTLSLGIINIVSAHLPAIADRMSFLRKFLPENVIFLSSFTVTVLGILLILLSANLIRGLKSAWLATVIIISLSALGHITKAVDYEEAIFSVLVLTLLLYTRKNYTVKSDERFFHLTKWYFFASILFILIYGTVGFYLMDVKHFGIDFNIGQSAVYLLNSLILLNNDILPAHTHFGHWFITSLNFLGGGFWLFTFYVLLKPYRHKHDNGHNDIERATELLKLNGRSPLDYFKIYPDKSIYICSNQTSFVSFKIHNEIAMVLEGPTYSSVEELAGLIDEFDLFCEKNGLKAIYYRVDQDVLSVFHQLKKKSIFIGQEGIVDLPAFSLEGGDRKTLRNGLNKVKAQGYSCKIYTAPLKDGLIQKLKAVSDEWLDAFRKKESGFTQGVWNAAEIKGQTVIVVENQEEKVVAFANIIPDYSPNEGTYDLIRKLKDVPGGVLDVIMVEMISYFKSQNIQYLNLGMAPFSGIEQAQSFKERTIKFAYENLRQFDHFKGLRFFKEKYATVWRNKYLVYSNDIDLLQAPVVLEKVSKV